MEDERLPIRKIVVDSRERTAGTPSEFQVQLPEAITLPKHFGCYVTDIQCQHSFRTVHGNASVGMRNHHFYFFERLVSAFHPSENDFTVLNRSVLSPGSYTPTELCAELQTQMNAVDPQKEPFAFSEYDPEALDKIIRRQFKIAEYQKKKGQDVFQVGIIVDDMADEPKFTRQSKLLHQLYIRGRHAFITVITAVQKVTTLAPIIRTQATHIFTFRLRSMQDLETWLNENSAVYPKETLLALYNYCVQQPYGFLYQDLMVQDANEMFHFKFDDRLRVEEKTASKKTHDQVPSAASASRPAR